jgi:glycosyltransferase involved in cell wall biosynthesis
LFSSAATGKRFDVVLDAFSRILAARPDAELVLIGDLGAPTLPRVREVTEAVRRHPASSRIRITGKLELAAVAREVAELDVYLFPMDTGANTRSGTLPVALGAGVPAVCLDGVETEHPLFRGDENVLFASALTGPAFAEAALRVLSDGALATRVREGARALYEEHLSWPRVTEHFLEVVA